MSDTMKESDNGGLQISYPSKTSPAPSLKENQGVHRTGYRKDSSGIYNPGLKYTDGLSDTS